ncbi:mannonate dehydratase [Paraglaciecola polaris]|uniref:mannonate dehydratase n=1 Tax=Paraglaciecola polaris TaxID=222814 RepID=UPI00031E0A83|nr:mannonate dehydratase [Paraglaciecola polaris]|tara:strand:- start:1718 stop:2917 length:1200 start_codon:yes stop_codon:yes gene_type:complete
MRESWRWFGPNDPVTIDEIRQTGATDVVSALHSIPTGEIWTQQAIRQHQLLIEECEPGLAPLTWSVVESIPVHEDIKLARPGHEKYVENWIVSMENLAQCGIKTICYNFMPVIDWTRTDLNFKLPSGAYALRFDQKKFAAFDLFILKREHAEVEYSAGEIAQAKLVFEAMSEAERTVLTNNIIAGLPGKMTDSYGLDDFRSMLANYKDMNSDALRQNLFAFLSKVLPRAEAMDVKLAIHPDDPPRDMLGLPRIICTADDLNTLFQALPSPSNGITLCVGTYSSRPDNDLPAMAKQFGPRIHFSHLRGVSRDPDEQRSFIEASHLDSDIDMVQVIKELLNEESRRTEKEAEGQKIFIRPDHGHQMMGDIGKSVNPGYSGIGRMKGLAEVRGVIRALSAQK